MTLDRDGMMDELRLLKVFHRASGACVFSRRWKWDAQAHEEAVDALVLSFAQFAREIDGGEVVQVHFDPAVGGKQDEARRPASEPLQFSPTQGGVTMESRQDALAQAALFHDRVSDAGAAPFKAALERILERFSDRFGLELAALATELPPNATLSSEQRAELEARFEGFGDEINALLVAAATTDDGTSSSNYTNTMNGRAGPL